MLPLVDAPDLTIYVGDVLDVLPELPNDSIHCCVTSPPYWGLRDYGTGTWEGGDPSCGHTRPPGGTGGDPKFGANKGNAAGAPTPMGRECIYCGALRVDRQLGLEATPSLYVESMVAVFREVRRVLRTDGVCWLNLGDSYVGGGRGGEDGKQSGSLDRGRAESGLRWGQATGRVEGLKHKDLVGIPWRVAFALQDDGWYLRADVIWNKPNPMPESVTDRPTKAHEYVFMLTKQPRYFYDADAIAEEAQWYGPNGQPANGPHAGQMQGRAGAQRPQMVRALQLAEQHGLTDEHFAAIRQAGLRGDPAAAYEAGVRGLSDVDELAQEAKDALGSYYREFLAPPTKNARSVWSIATEQFAEAHFATFPTELPRRCILAATSERGCCPECGAPWERTRERLTKATWHNHESDIVVGQRQTSNEFKGANFYANYKSPRTLGWRPTCSHYDELYHRDFPKARRSQRNRGRWQRMTWWDRVTRRAVPDRFGWPVEPCVVLDPFLGSGTTAKVARDHGRRCIGVELKDEYARLAEQRNAQLTIFA